MYCPSQEPHRKINSSTQINMFQLRVITASFPPPPTLHAVRVSVKGHFNQNEFHVLSFPSVHFLVGRIPSKERHLKEGNV